MHPALSVIIFTTASGAGYGLLSLVGVLVWRGGLQPSLSLGVVLLGTGLGLVSLGLLASTWHLGHPERSWRAFSQWRSSWLSREGMVAMLSYAPALGLAWFWLGEGDLGGHARWLGLVLSILSIATVFCTAMIYRSLATIAQWCNGWTVPCYLVFSMMSGVVVLNAILFVAGLPSPHVAAASVVACVFGGVFKSLYWRQIDANTHPSTPGSATGLGHLGQVRSFETPHSGDNYVMKEMGFAIARKHATKLRRYTSILAFILPLGFSLIALLDHGVVATLSACAAVLGVTLGLLIERWLFFAEARHVVTLYYGAEKV